MLVAPEILVKLVPSGDDCHWIVPEWPDKVKAVALVPEQTVPPPPEMLPAVGAGLAVTIALPVIVNVVPAQPPVEEPSTV